MKKGSYIILTAFIALFAINFISAAGCDLQVSLLSQDPYPAVPGDYVKLVFQVQGTQNPECQDLHFQLVPKFPISLDPNVSPETTISSKNYLADYSNSVLIPYKARLDDNTLDGDNPIEVKYYQSNIVDNSYYLTKQFNINVKDVRTTFEAYVKNFNFATNTLTIQVLNSGKSNVDALTIEIPEQDGVTVKGSNKNIVGSLDANEYTTSDFEVSPNKADIKLNLYYTDKIGVRRFANTTIQFTPSNFEGRKTASTGSSTWLWILVIIVIIVIYFLYRRYKKNQKKKLHG